VKASPDPHQVDPYIDPYPFSPIFLILFHEVLL
jgi:hypothetical protein